MKRDKQKRSLNSLIAFTDYWPEVSLDEAVDTMRRALIEHGLDGGVLIPCLIVFPSGAAPSGVIALGLAPVREGKG